MTQLTHSRRQPAVNLTKRIGSAEVAEQHRHELIPAGKSFRALLGLVPPDSPIKISTRNQRQNLGKHARNLYHSFVSVLGVLVIMVKAIIPQPGTPSPKRLAIYFGQE